jgi:hypothetical protein
MLIIQDAASDPTPCGGRGKACCHAGNFRRSALAPSDVITGLVPVIPMV